MKFNWAFEEMFELFFRDLGEVSQIWKWYAVNQLRKLSAKLFEVFRAVFGVRTASGVTGCYHVANKDLSILRPEASIFFKQLVYKVAGHAP